MKITNDEIYELEQLLYQEEIVSSRNDLLKFTQTTFKKFKPEWFHNMFYNILNRFAHKEIKNLIVTMPPQHGKSEGGTRRLPAFLAGFRPDDKIAIVSYAATKAQKFGREIMNIMREKEYKDIFPRVQYPERGYTGAKSNTNMERESVNSSGSMKFVGVDGPLTGETVDILILDDLYKGWKDANSPVMQQSVWDWYLTVADSRLHNESQQLITFTRWSDQDVIAKLIDIGLVIVYDCADDLDKVIENLNDQFLLINFQALKEGKPSRFDPRKEGDALWSDKHSRKKHETIRSKDPNKFDCLYQGNPQNKEGVLYGNEFKTYKRLPDLKIVKNYTDTADTGKDYLCSIVYGIPLGSTDPHKYVLDVLYTQQGMEITEPLTAQMLNRNKVNQAWIESNNGGRGFARNIKKLVNDSVNVDWFHQSSNKEARIYSNSASVNSKIVFPGDWHIRWSVFYKHITKYKKIFGTNDFDDAPDALTGIIEIEEKTEVVHETHANADDLGLF